MGFSRQEYWSGLPCLPLGDLLNPGIEPASLMSPALAGRFFSINASREAQYNYIFLSIISQILRRKKNKECPCTQYMQ